MSLSPVMVSGAYPYKVNLPGAEAALSRHLLAPRDIGIALLVSILLHTFIMQNLAWLTRFKSPPPRSITASFSAPPAPSLPAQAAPPITVPEPAKPEPIKPTPTPVKPATTKPAAAEPVLKSEAIAQPEDFSVREEKPSLQSTPQTAPEATPANPAPSPSASAAQTDAAAQPNTAESSNNKPSPAPQPAPPNLDGDLLGAYGRDLQKLCEKNKQYPAIAIKRNLEGAGSVEVQFSVTGQLISLKILQSTGQASLDAQALVMVKKSLAELPLPTQLKGQAFTLAIPIAFKLE